MEENRNDAMHSLDKLVEKERLLQKKRLSPEEVSSFINCYKEHRKTLLLIQQYDENKDENSVPERNYYLTTETANILIALLKENLSETGENLQQFGVHRNGGIEKVLGNIYQTYGKKDLYPTQESKAAHLFYFLIKDHLFVDGNKRIAAFLLVWLLDMNDMLFDSPAELVVSSPATPIISYNTIYSLAIFVAESDPKEKEVIIKYIIALIKFYKRPDL